MSDPVNGPPSWWPSWIPGAGAVWSAIAWVVNGVWHLAESAFDVVWSSFRQVWSWGAGIVSWATSWFNALWSGLSRIFGYWIPWLWNQIWSAFQRAVDWAWGAIRQLWSWATAAIAQVWSWLQGLYRWILANVWTPLWNGIQALWHGIEQALQWVLRNVWDPLWSFVTGLARQVWDVLSKAWDWILHAGAFVWDVVNKSLWFLKWVILGPVALIELVWKMLSAGGPDQLWASLIRSIEHGGEAGEEWLVRWLGL